MKQRVKQNNLFKQHDHATVLSLLAHFDFDGSVSSHMTYHRYIWIAVLILYFLSYHNSSVFFCMKIFRQMKKNIGELINWLFCNTIHKSVWQLTANIRDSSKSIFLFQESFFLEKTVFGLLHYWAIQIRYFRKKLLLQQIQVIWRFEKRLMVLQYFIIDNNTRMSVFLWEMFFNNIMNITSTWCINQFLVLNTFSFLFPRSFLVINWISISLDSLCLESSGSFHFVFEFLDISCPFIDDVR